MPSVAKPAGFPLCSAAPGTAVIFAASRVYQRRWRYAGQRDYEAVVRAAVLIVLLTVAAIEIFRPTHSYPARQGGRRQSSHGGSAGSGIGGMSGDGNCQRSR